MKAISKTDLKARDEIASKLQDRRTDLDQAMEEFNLAMDTAWGAVEVARDALNEVIVEANTWKEEMASAIQEYMDERSDKWQESDKASAYTDWKSQFEETFEEIEIDQPEKIDPNLEAYEELLWQIPEELPE